MSGQEVVAALGSFGTGSSAGLDGLRPAHLKDMTSRLAGEAGVRLAAALTKLVNLIIDGAVPSSARAAIFGASLVALRKPDGGIRPIAIGTTYRRLATKLALWPLREQLGDQLRPLQLGYGTAGGCEAAHTVAIGVQTWPIFDFPTFLKSHFFCISALQIDQTK